MYNIIYIGKNDNLDIQKMSLDLTKMNNEEIRIIKEKDLDAGINHLFFETSVILLIIEEDIDGAEDSIRELKKDEAFKFMPIIIIINQDDIEKRKRYYSLSIDGIINRDFSVEEIVLICNSVIKHKIRLDQVLSQLGEVSEKNITKAIQLDLLRKFIPLTVWEKTEDLAEAQDFEIPEEEQELAIIFADLETFTTMAEKQTPKEVIQMLNGIFDIATQIIYQNFGDIDKFIGDAFLAVFKHPEMALLSAIMIQDEIVSYNENRRRNNQNTSNFRLGVHYGKVIRGSVGGTVRFDNTLIGDPINTAQRLESMSPAGGILASKDIILKVKSLKDFNIPYKNYNLKGKDREIEATLFYEYYKEHPEIKTILFKERIRIEKEAN
ncbi:MAG TPA: adenylate/guanylate cyclase domain-containing protein [Spirochaetota bacterium]|nr:adenylate/guanylate cyclase domain-containing protein [Spirochaetota bacterium]HPP03365.1 adenylate/guanylate cyclase domain-containing protein [Spirochaetota bacterium]